MRLFLLDELTTVYSINNLIVAVAGSWRGVRTGIIIVVTGLSHILLGLPASSDDALVGCLCPVVSWVKLVNALLDILHGMILAGIFSILSVVGVASGVEVLVTVVEEDVLRVEVDQVALLLGELELGDEAGNSELLDNPHDIELLIETCLGLSLQVVVSLATVSAAEAPWGREVLLTNESPHGVLEGLTPLSLEHETLLEAALILGRCNLVVR